MFEKDQMMERLAPDTEGLCDEGWQVLHTRTAAQFFFCKSIDSHEVDRLSFSLVILRGKVHGVEGAAAAFPVV